MVPSSGFGKSLAVALGLVLFFAPQSAHAYIDIGDTTITSDGVLSLTSAPDSSVTVTAGAGSAGANAGGITLVPGVGGNGDEFTNGGNGGNFGVNFGAGGSTVWGTAGVGGGVSWTLGQGGYATGGEPNYVGNAGVGGSFSVTAGNGGDGGQATTGGNGGVISLIAGNGGGASGGGLGGGVTIKGGNGGTNVGSGVAGGNVDITAGNGSNADPYAPPFFSDGAAGNVNISAGNSGSSKGVLAGGNVNLTVGEGASSAVGRLSGAVVIAAGTNAASHLKSTQATAPVVTAGAGGLDPSCNGCTDMKGQIVGKNDINGATFTLTFNKSYATAPYCVFAPADIDAARSLNRSASNGMYVTSTPTSMTLTYMTGSYLATYDSWNYQCIE